MNSRLKNIVVIVLIVTLMAFSVSLQAKAKEQKLSGKAKASLNGAVISMQLKNYPKALGQYLEVLKSMPTHVSTLREVSVLYFTMAEESSESVEEMLTSLKNSNEYRLKTIAAIEGLADWRNYEEKGVSFEDYHKEATQTILQNIYKHLFDVAKEYYDDEDLEVSEQIFKECLAVDPSRTEAYQMLAVIAQDNDDEEMKLEYLSKMGEVAGDNPIAIYTIAGAYKSAEDYDNAIHYYQRYIELRPDDANGYLSMGEIYWVRENYNEAYKFLQQALELEPKDPDILANALDMAVNLKDEAKSVEYAKRLVDLNATFENLDNLCQLLISSQDWQEVMKYADRWYEADTENALTVQMIIFSAQRANNSTVENKYKAIQRGM